MTKDWESLFPPVSFRARSRNLLLRHVAAGLNEHGEERDVSTALDMTKGARHDKRLGIALSPCVISSEVEKSLTSPCCGWVERARGRERCLDCARHDKGARHDKRVGIALSPCVISSEVEKSLTSPCCGWVERARGSERCL